MQTQDFPETPQKFTPARPLRATTQRAELHVEYFKFRPTFLHRVRFHISTLAKFGLFACGRNYELVTISLLIHAEISEQENIIVFTSRLGKLVLGFQAGWSPPAPHSHSHSHSQIHSPAAQSRLICSASFQDWKIVSFTVFCLLDFKPQATFLVVSWMVWLISSSS